MSNFNQQVNTSLMDSSTLTSEKLPVEKFEQLDLKEIGINLEDFNEVASAYQDLENINHTVIAEYGKNIANKTSAYTDELLDLVKNKDLDMTGQQLNKVVQAAQQLNTASILQQPKNSGFITKLLNKFKSAKQGFDQHFNSTKEQIDALVQEIEISQNGLKARVDTLDRMFQSVQEEYRQLGIYIAAGRIKHEEVQQQISTLTMQEQDPQTTQSIYDLNHLYNNLEKRVSDLQVLQQSAMQTLPMIRIIQSNNLMLVDKFYAVKNITLPAWKNQISLAISLTEQRNSVELANSIDNATNDLLKRNAEMLHQNSVATAKANQRSVIDIETLEQVQNTLIKTVNDVIQVQKEGMQKREEASNRLKVLQMNLQKLVLDTTVQKK